MKTILLALLVSVTLLNTLVMTARTMADHSAADQRTARLEAEILGMRQQIAEIEANAQTAGSFRRMSLDEHRQQEGIDRSLNAAYSRASQAMNAVVPSSP